jgi:4-hydroxy-4-methyl-2-oxoglutarate aldolase
MFRIEGMPAQIPASLIERLGRVETATVGHVLHSGFVDPAIRAVLPGVRVAGTAVTVLVPGVDSAMMHYAVGLARPGDFLVIDRCGDSRHACWGGVITHAAKIAGVVGGVMDGFATDLSEVRDLAMPLWCRGPTPITCKKLGLEGAMNVPVSIGGVVVEPGDAILGDESGVLVLKPGQVESVARRALEMQAEELKTLARLRSGEKLADISGAAALIEKRNAAART